MLYRHHIAPQQPGLPDYTGQCAGSHITRQPPAVVGQMERPARAVCGQLGSEHADNTAAHAEAMHSAEQTDKKRRDDAELTHSFDLAPADSSPGTEPPPLHPAPPDAVPPPATAQRYGRAKLRCSPATRASFPPARSPPS